MNSEQQKYGRLIAKIMSDQITPEESIELETWLLASEENMKLFDALTSEESIPWAKKWFAKAGISTKDIRWRDPLFWYRLDKDTTVGFYLVIGIILVLMDIVYWVLKYA